MLACSVCIPYQNFKLQSLITHLQQINVKYSEHYPHTVLYQPFLTSQLPSASINRLNRGNRWQLYSKCTAKCSWCFTLGHIFWTQLCMSGKTQLTCSGDTDISLSASSKMSLWEGLNGYGPYWLSFSRYSKLGASNLCSWSWFFVNSFSISMTSPW